MIDFRVLGATGLTGLDGIEIRSVVRQPKRLALLSFLTLTSFDRYQRRDRLLALFWPESDEKHARSSLSEALSRFRASLSPEAILTRGTEEVGINPQILTCDAVRFEEAFEDRRFEEAAGLYRGPLLDGFVLDNGVDFDLWLEERRAHFARCALDAMGRLADSAMERGDTGSLLWAERALKLAPLDGGAVRRVMTILATSGHRAAAIKAFEAFAVRLDHELGMAPSNDLVDLAGQIRGGQALDPVAPRRTRVQAVGMTANDAPPDPQADWTPGGGEPKARAEPSESPRPTQALLDLDEDSGPGLEDGPPPGEATIDGAQGDGAAHRERGSRWTTREAVPWGIAALLAVVVVGLVVAWPETAPPIDVRFVVRLADEGMVTLGSASDAEGGRPRSTSVAFSPNGEALVYAARGDGESQLYLRRLDREAPQPISETQGASSPFFSPDGSWVGFFTGDMLKRVSIPDLDVETIVAETRSSGLGADRSLDSFGATWGDDGTIVYASPDGLYRVQSTGGVPHRVLEVDPGANEAVRYCQPHMLPGSRILLVHAFTSRTPDGSQILAVDLDSGMSKPVLSDARDPRYAEIGHLLFLRGGALMAVDFDALRLTTSGVAKSMIDDVMQSDSGPHHEPGVGQLAYSAAGHLVYASGAGAHRSLSTGSQSEPGSGALGRAGAAELHVIVNFAHALEALVPN